MVFVITPGSREWLHRTFRDLVDELYYVTTFYKVGGVRDVAEVWEMEFSDCSFELIAAIRFARERWNFRTPLIWEVLHTDSPELHEALASDPYPAGLAWCVRRYKEYHRNHWQDALTASGPCGVTSQDFLMFLLDKGRVTQHQIKSGFARVVTHYFGDREDETPDFPRECHSVVQVGNICICWTARQFPSYYGPDCPFPVIWVNRSGQDQVFAPR